MASVAATGAASVAAVGAPSAAASTAAGAASAAAGASSGFGTGKLAVSNGASIVAASVFSLLTMGVPLISAGMSSERVWLDSIIALSSGEIKVSSDPNSVWFPRLTWSDFGVLLSIPIILAKKALITFKIEKKGHGLLSAPSASASASWPSELSVTIQK